jgi:type I restriction enzyme M protein
MNSATKRHIDAARQVLVGVVPNPTSQIDQITYALIYKFMDDMDQSAVKNGDEPAFFTGDLEQYSWARIMDTKIGNQDRMNLYVVAFQKFAEAKQLPELFRNILKSAFLPYRSPETLGLFLKEIDYFDYSHPEELGNAYEYLLSIMSSQGEAGQFRTPRHIIDFIVDVVNPTKDDKVLDPACGTGGFLVSSYKHILEKHDGKDDSKKQEKSLTPDERTKLMANFEGYDIDPTMVRISQVNMYLHQFKNPKIFQYDSLSSDERWNDKFDVILANPPFMSPKGGIKPHSKFSIPSSRSEVLFVDYIMNHLRPKGRAGIIVPEGIIFQSGTAHKQLRKNLVEDGLYAVVSLPSGVFAPYSGVKTSVLLFDNELAKQNTEILFVKIEQDGFDLGATKRPISKNDLPTALDILNKWRAGEKVENKLAVYVEKTKIAEGGDYNLSGDRYRVATDYTNAKWPMVELKELCDITTGKKDVNEGNPDGEYPFFTCAKENTFIDTFSFDTEALLIAGNGDVGAVKYYKGKFDAYQRTYVLSNFQKINVRYLFQVLNNSLKENMQLQKLGNTMPYIKLGMLQTFLTPLPPLEIQEQIVAELDGYAGIIAGAKQITQNWKPKIDIDPEWEKVKLGEISDRVTKGTTPTTNGFSFQDSGINFIKIESIDDGGNYIEGKFAHIDKECNESLKRSQLKSGDVLFSIAGALGRVALVKDSILPANTNQALAIISPKEDLSSKYLEQVLRSDLIQSQIYGLKVGVAQSNLSLAQVSDFEIPLPPLAIQKQIVEKIEAERVLVDSSKKLIDVYEQKTKEVIAKLWNE